MAIEHLPPISTESEKPIQLNLEQMYLDRKALIEAGTPEAKIPVWEVYVRQEYRNSLTDEVTLNYIQRFRSDGEVQIIGTNLGKIEHSEYRAEDAFRHLNQSVVQIEEPTHYRFYTTDISVLNQDAMRAPDQSDTLKKEFERLQNEGNIVFGPPLDEEALWEAVHGTPVIKLGTGEAFDLDRQAAEKARQDQARAEADALRLQAVEAADYVRELAEIEELRAAARAERENAEVGGELSAVRAEIAGSLDKDQEAEMLKSLWSTNSSGIESKMDTHPKIKNKEDLINAGFIMGAPQLSGDLPWVDVVSEIEEIRVETRVLKGVSSETTSKDRLDLIKVIEIPEPQPIPGQPTIFWPHIEPTEITEGEDSPVENPEVPEGVKVITYKTRGGKEQTRYKRIKDGKFVGKDGLTKKEREGKVLKNGAKGYRNGNGQNGNGHGKGHLEGTTVIAQRIPKPKERKPRAPEAEATVERPARFPVTVFDYDPSQIIVDRNMVEYRALDGLAKAKLDAHLRNLRPEYDLEADEDEILRLFGVHVSIRRPQQAPVKR